MHGGYILVSTYNFQDCKSTGRGWILQSKIWLSQMWSVLLGELFLCQLLSSEIRIISLGGGGFLVWNSRFNINKSTDELPVCIYLCKLVVTCSFRFNIHDLFVYFFKLMSTTASQMTTCFYLLMQITCWLHVFFVLIFMIYLFTSSKWCQQQHRKWSPVFIYLCK